MASPEVILARAPANIALVKYMGKTESGGARNPSISLTLDRLCTFAEVTDLCYEDSRQARSFHWVDEPPRHLPPGFPLSWRPIPDAGPRIERFLSVLAQQLPGLFREFDLEFRLPVSFELRTANTFPSSAGIASSASAFAAITVAVARAQATSPERFAEWLSLSSFRMALARIARLGSGSASRSFHGPWVHWNADAIHDVESQLPPCSDLVLVVSGDPKSVGSSEAHRRVVSSYAWDERPARATVRADELTLALKQSDWAAVVKLSWEDFLDMHQLFHTSDPPFTYWQPKTVEVLRWLMQVRTETSEPEDLPIVTLDAGPNIHTIVPTERISDWKDRVTAQFPGMVVLQDNQGTGAELL